MPKITKYINLSGLVIPVKIIRKSALSVTVEVAETVKAYRKGDKVLVNHWEIKTFDLHKVEIKNKD